MPQSAGAGGGVTPATKVPDSELLAISHIQKIEGDRGLPPPLRLKKDVKSPQRDHGRPAPVQWVGADIDPPPHAKTALSSWNAPFSPPKARQEDAAASRTKARTLHVPQSAAAGSVPTAADSVPSSPAVRVVNMLTRCCPHATLASPAACCVPTRGVLTSFRALTL